jgi:hypothetical protein
MIQFTSSSQEALIVKLSALTFISLNFLRMPIFPSLLISSMSSNIGVRHAERGSSICKLDVDMKLDCPCRNLTLKHVVSRGVRDISSFKQLDYLCILFCFFCIP